MKIAPKMKIAGKSVKPRPFVTVEELLQHVSPELLREAAAALPRRQGGRRLIGATAGRTWHLRATSAELESYRDKAQALEFPDVSTFVRETVEDHVPLRYQGGTDEGGPREHRVGVRLPDDVRARWEHLAEEHGYPDLGSYVRAVLKRRRV